MSKVSADANALFAAASSAFAVGDYARVLAVLEPSGRPIAETGPVFGLLGAAHGAMGDRKAAIRYLTRAAKKSPGDPVLHHNLGGALLADGRAEAAIEHHERAVRLAPHVAAFQSALGTALFKSLRVREAEKALRAALAADPDFAEAVDNLGRLYLALGVHSAALPLLERTTELEPSNTDAWQQLGGVLMRLRRPVDALAAVERALSIDPSHIWALVDRVSLRRELCDWQKENDEVATIRAAVKTEPTAVAPMFAVAQFDEPNLHLAIASAHSAAWAHSRPRGHAVKPMLPAADGRIKLLYVSADFRDHAVAHVMRGLLAHHDRSKFFVIAASLGLAPDSAMRTRMKEAVDHFVDVGFPSRDELTALLRSFDADIAIDLMGYTHGQRLEAFHDRIAPVQVTHIGFPGTTGVPAMDYIIADRHLIGPDDRRFYTERVVTLPRTYQPNDPERIDAVGTASRGDFGLPADGFVYCCFNGARKFTRPAFDLWTDILRRVPKSVLWMLGETEDTRSNLRREASARGIDGDRIVFAEFIPYQKHLQRYLVADCALDTFPYNGHMTGSDAIWMGCPLVGITGKSFASRVSKSLLGSVGAPELAADSPEAFVGLAVRMAEDRAFHVASRAKLARPRLLETLYDVGRYTRELEWAYYAMLDRRKRGLSPADIAVPELASDGA